METPMTHDKTKQRIIELKNENKCQDCNIPFEDWLTDGRTWRNIVGEYNGILCTSCFLRRAYKNKKEHTPRITHWYLTPLSFPEAPDPPDLKVKVGEIERLYKLLESERDYCQTHHPRITP